MNFNKVIKPILLLLSILVLPGFTVYDPSPKTKKAIQLSGPIPVKSGRVVQGLVLLKDFSNRQRWLFTQDLINGYNLFNIIDIYKNKKSKLVKSFKVKSSSHVQSIIKVNGKCRNGLSGYKFYTPGPKGDGLYTFCLEKDLARLHPPVRKSIYIKEKKKIRKLKFSTLDFDFGANRAVVMSNVNKKKHIFILNLNDFFKKKVARVIKRFALSTGQATLDKSIKNLPVQGLALTKIKGKDRYVNVLIGYRDINENKYLIKYDLDSGKIKKARIVKSAMSYARKEGKEREPEGLSYYNGSLYYTIATGLVKKRLTRLYALPENKF